MRTTLICLLAFSAALPAMANAPREPDLTKIAASKLHSTTWRAHPATERTTAIAGLITYAEARNFPLNSDLIDELGDTVFTTPPVADYSDEWRTHFAGQRVQHIHNLREYAGAGVFPQNDFELGLTSMLRDASGRPCAMAYVVETSGHAAIIDDLVSSQNTVQFASLSEGALYDWTLTSGLLREEAAMVQVPDMNWDVGMDSAYQEQLQLAEVVRIQAHLGATALALEAVNTTVIDTAIERLGNRIYTLPPADTTLASL
ncbi:MAG: hypothetical protein ACJAV2_001436 [Myxococcota bacterium]|jgi:hypothetical protein